MKTTKKKSFKRLFAFLMAFVMVTALAANAVFAAGSFTDVSEGDDFYENIESLYEQGIIGGFADGTFRPGDYLTRQQAAKMIALGANYGDHDGTGSKLVDVADLTWGQENIWALEAAGVVKGFGTSKEFRPRLNITRGHVAKMIALAFGLEEGDVEVDLIDLPADEEVADAIRILASNGIVSGFGKSKEFRPDALVTRGQFAKMVDLAMEAVQLKVVSVRAINGVTIEVRFNKPVNKTSAERIGSLSKVDIAGVSIKDRTLSDDGKVLTLNVRMQRYGNRALDVTNAAVEVKPVRSKDDSSVRSLRYVGLLTYKDTVRPTVVGVTYPDANTAKITFSEPMGTYGAVVLSAGTGHNTNDTYYEVNITDLEEGDTATVTFTGAKDYAGNFVSPNPVSVDIVKPGEEPADETPPTVLSMRVISDTKVEVVFSEELSSVKFSINGNEVAAANIETADDDVTYSLNVALVDGVNKVSVTEFKDLAGIDGVAPVTQQFIVTLDKVAPTLIRSEVLVDETSGKEYLELTFSKEIKLGTQAAFTGTHDFVSGQTFAVNPEVDTEDATIVTVPLKNAAKGNWTIKLEEGFVEDLTASKNKLEAVDVSFVRGEDVDPSAPAGEVKLISAGVASNVATLKFNGKLDGVSATNKANYLVEGVVVKAAKLTVNTTSAEVELTFEAGSIKTSGDYQLVLSGVKAANGSAVVSAPETLTLVENIAPFLKTAVLVSGTEIELTFSEIVTGVKTTATYDFVVKVGTEERAISSVSGSGTGWKIVIGSLSSADLAKTITLELADTIAIKDNAGNALVDFDSLAVTVDIK